MSSVLCFSVAVNRVATYRELDNDLLKQAAFLTLVSVNNALNLRGVLLDTITCGINHPWNLENNHERSISSDMHHLFLAHLSHWLTKIVLPWGSHAIHRVI